VTVLKGFIEDSSGLLGGHMQYRIFSKVDLVGELRFLL